MGDQRILYHYTCAHSLPLIIGTHIVKPGPDGLVWFTDLDHPFREALGLTANFIKCDRTEYRFRVDDPDARIVEWTAIRRRVPILARVLEDAPGVMPRHWFVSLYPVRVVPDFLERASA